MRKKTVAWMLLALLLVPLLAPQRASALPPLWDLTGTNLREPIQRLYDLGIVTGNPDGSYGPNDTVTRAQMAAFAVRALGDKQPPSAGAQFRDVPANHWAVQVVGRASELGLIRGDGQGTFRPNDPVTYAEATAILVRMLGYDPDVVGSWPTGYVMKGQELGLINAMTRFALNEPISRRDLGLALDVAVFQVNRRGMQVTLSQSVHRKAAKIAIAPDAAVVLAGNVQLEARTLDPAGRELPGSPVTWRVVDGSATVSQAGLLNAAAGTVTVEASFAGMSARATYQVVDELRISGLDASVEPNATRTLRAVGVSGNTEVPVTADWSVTGGNATITQSGVLTVKGFGEIEVTATVGSLKATASAVVGSDFVVSPATVTMATGESTTFRALAGNVPLTNVQWTVVSGNGSITREGVFTAGSAASVVRAKVGGLSAEARVDVYNALVVTPETLSLSKGESVNLSAKLVSTGGAEKRVSPQWSVTRTLGIIDQSGGLIATNPGQGSVTVSYGGMTVNVPLTVSGEASRIVVSAARQTLPANGKSQTTITGRIVDSNGIPVHSATGKLTFGLSDGIMGSLSSTEAVLQNGEASVTFTTSQRVGTVRVLAGAQGLSVLGDWLDLTLNAPGVAGAKISVPSTSVAVIPGAHVPVTVTLVDQDGEPVFNNSGSYISTYLTSSGPGSLSQSQVSVAPGLTSGSTTFVLNGTPGTVHINGSAGIAVTGTTFRTVVTGPAAKLGIRSVTPVKADGVQEAIIAVEVQDAQGAVRTQDGNMSVTLYGQFPDGTLNSLPQIAPVQGGVATFRIRSTKAGTLSLTARASNLEAGTGTAQYLPGDAARVALTVAPADPLSPVVANIAADGGLTTVVLRAEIQDTFGNRVTNGSQSVTFIREQNTGVTQVPANMVVGSVDGIAELHLRSTSAIGSDTFSAYAGTLQRSGTVSVNARITGVPEKAHILPVASVTVGTETTVRVRIVDSQGYLVSGASGMTVSLMSNSATFVSDGPQPVVGGMATFKVRESRNGSWALTAQATGLTSAATPTYWTVNPGMATRIRLVATPDSVPSDGSVRATVRVEAVDEYGNPAATSTMVTLTAEGGTLSGTMLSAGGYVFLNSVAANATVTIRGSAANGLPVEPVTIRSYTPAEPSHVVLELPAEAQVGTQYQHPVTIKVKVLDVNGNVATQVQSNGSTVSLAGISLTGLSGNNTAFITNSGPSGLATYGFSPDGVNRGSANLTYGVATLQYSNTKAETVTVTPVVYYQGRLLPSTSATITTKPGTASQLALDGGGLTIKSDGYSSLMLTGRVADTFGNAVSAADDTITINLDRHDLLTLTTPASAVTSNGSAVFRLVSKATTGGSTLVTASSAKTGLTTTVRIITDRPPSQPQAWGYAAYGGTTVISPASGGLYIQAMAESRVSDQTVTVYVNGMAVNVYTTQLSDVRVTSIPSGGTVFSGYIRYADLGAPGTKEIRVVLSSPLGTGSFSPAFTITVTP